MVTFEALNALYGDCLLLRYPGQDTDERFWLIDGGPKSATVEGKNITVWHDVLLPRLQEISPAQAAFASRSAWSAISTTTTSTAFRN